MIIMKFGGSSAANAERIKSITAIIKEHSPRRPVVVLSAMGDVTDHLLEAARKALLDGPSSVEKSFAFLENIHREAIKELAITEGQLCEINTLLEELAELISGISLIRELTPKTKDYLLSFGERLSVRITAAYFNRAGLKAKAFDAWDAGITSTAVFNEAEPLPECYENIPKILLPLINDGVIPVVTGFIAKCYAEEDDRTMPTAGDITTLGRGGSDLTATLLAAALGAEEAQVWKDVDGVLTADPRIVPEAQPVEHITYGEAAELAYFGAQVLHPRAMLPCMKTGIPVLVKNSYAPALKGTRISKECPKPESSVRAITSKNNITVIDIASTRMLGQFGFLSEVFNIFASHKISIDVIATSEVSISLTVDKTKGLPAVKKDLERIADVEIKTGKAIITIICDTSCSTNILSRIFAVCDEAKIICEMVSHGASKVNISLIIPEDGSEKTVRYLHKEFFRA